MAEYEAVTDNGICTCGLSVARYGWVENAMATWGTPTPVASHFGANLSLGSFDEGPKLSGTSELYVVDGDGSETRIMRQSFANSPTYFNYADVLKSFVYEVPNGEAYRFRYVLSSAVFSYIELVAPDGSVERKKDVDLAVADTFVFRQREDTQSWGSPNQDVLFWPWQQTR